MGHSLWVEGLTSFTLLALCQASPGPPPPTFCISRPPRRTALNNTRLYSSPPQQVRTSIFLTSVTTTLCSLYLGSSVHLLSFPICLRLPLPALRQLFFSAPTRLPVNLPFPAYVQARVPFSPRFYSTLQEAGNEPGKIPILRYGAHWLRTASEFLKELSGED